MVLGPRSGTFILAAGSRFWWLEVREKASSVEPLLQSIADLTYTFAPFWTAIAAECLNQFFRGDVQEDQNMKNLTHDSDFDVEVETTEDV